MQLPGFIGPSYTLAHKSAGVQRVVNLYPELYEAGPRKDNVARFVGTPGLRLLATLGSGPIRGTHRASTGQLFVVSGSKLYEVFSHWSAQERSGDLASSSGRVSMADDGTQLLIGDGNSTAFVALLAGGSAMTPVPDANCPGGHVAWQDGYFIHTVPNTGRFATSELNSLTYDALDVATAEGRPDRLVTLLSVNRMLLLLGEQTSEVWFNSGAGNPVFARNDAAFLETGTIAAGTCVRVGGSAAWVGSDDRGRGTVWFLNGFALQRISNHAVEHALAGYSRLSEASAFAYQQGGHEFYQLTVPGGGTWCYDFATQQWHERSYQSTTGEEPHRAWVGCIAHGEVVVGDREDGRLYAYDPDYYTDAGTPIRRLRQSPHVSQNEKLIRFHSFELLAETGVGLSTGQGSAPVAVLSWSDDAGRTWSNEHQASLGAMGQYKNRCIWRRLGAARDRVFRVTMSDPVPVTWLGAEVNAVQLGT